MERDAFSAGRCGEEFGQFVLHLVVDLDGVHMASVGESLGQTQGRVAGECPEFEHAHGFYHRHEHGQHASLEMA